MLKNFVYLNLWGGFIWPKCFKEKNFPPISISNVWLRIMISLFPFQHSGHTFKPIDNEYDEHVHKVMDDLGLLKRRHTELISLVQDVVGITIYIML